MLIGMETETKPRLRLPAVLAVAVVAAPLMSGCGGTPTPANDAGQVDAQLADAGSDAGCIPPEVYDPSTMQCVPIV